MTSVSNLLEERRISKNDIQIWGGEVNETELKEFINCWALSCMPYAIVETFNEITIKSSHSLNIDAKNVERVRIFGKSGDLDLRRDSSIFRWRYIGNNNLPAGITGEDFWETDPARRFFVEEKEALLWGGYNKNRNMWYDDRVARATLSYPVNGKPDRVTICYKIFSEKGCISFVWFTELKGGIENKERT